MYKKVVSILFCIIILAGAANILYASADDIKSSVLEFTKKLKIDEFFSELEDSFKFDDKFDNILKNTYDHIQLAMCKQEIGNFTYYRNNETEGVIVVISDDVKSDIEGNAESIKKVYNNLQNEKVPFLYVNMPEEAKGELEKILKNIDYGNEISDMLLDEIKDIPNLDLRKNEKIKNMQENYYKTDHHWNLETCFESFSATVHKLNEVYELNLDKEDKYTNLNNYTIQTREKCFYGSKGLNVGYSYLEKENFNLFIPNYETKFEYKQYDTNGKLQLNKLGSFEDALVDKEKLDNPSYINKYTAFLYNGKAENIIINENSENDKKLLLISSSYGRSFAPYISQCFHETRYIDPRKGRFEKDILKYISDYKPDVVLMLYKENSIIDL